MTSMPSRRIGRVAVGAVGLGAMQLSLAGRPDEAGALRTIHAALDAGVTLIDTADAYCLDGSEAGHNERLVAKALAAWPGDRDRVLVATKGGHTRPGRDWGLDGRPEYLRRGRQAPPTASPSCRGARSAAWAGAAGSPGATRRSPRWPPVTASPRSRSRWRGSWPRPR